MDFGSADKKPGIHSSRNHAQKAEDDERRSPGAGRGNIEKRIFHDVTFIPVDMFSPCQPACFNLYCPERDWESMLLQIKTKVNCELQVLRGTE